MKFLFILKNRIVDHQYCDSYGLINSAKQVMHYLEHIGHKCHLENVLDANFIDAQIHKHKPDVVVIEALWVPGYKLKELIELPKYAKLQWIVRVHSNIGFLAAEGQAMKYVNDYLDLNQANLFIAFNNLEFTNSLNDISHTKFTYLPNIISNQNHIVYKKHKKYEIHIGCFGAMRIMKNHCFQAICAIKAADQLKKKLYFHVNHPAADPEKNPVLKNLIEIFKLNPKHELVLHKWLNNHEFNHLISKMDLGLQLSYSESFNIVSAEFVLNHVPIIGSKTISWLPFWLKSSTVKFNSLTNKILFVHWIRHNKILNMLTKSFLDEYNDEAKDAWRRFIKWHLK